MLERGRDDRQERELGEKIGVGHLALAQVTAGAAQIELLVNRRARDPFDEGPGRLLLFGVNVAVDAARPTADAVLLRLALGRRAQLDGRFAGDF